MNNSDFTCHLTEPKGSFAALLVGVLCVAGILGIMDYFILDLIPGLSSLLWIRQIFGVMSNNVETTDNTPWVYMIIILSSFIVGIIAIRWYKALLSAFLIPVVAGILYSLLNMSSGLWISKMFINPFFFTPLYIFPALLSSIMVSYLLSQKSSLGSKTIISAIR